MTKHVRIENADNADYRVVVQVWDKGYPEGQPDVLVQEIILACPTAMTPDNVYLTSTRYILVKELPAA
jgi:hypothetical protein